MQAVMRRAALLAAVLLLAGCTKNDEEMDRAEQLTGGNALRGQRLIKAYGCGACHTIPGVPGAHNSVGPNLAGLRTRMFIAGVLPNDAGNLIAWIHDPKAVDPKTAMPNVGVSTTDARDIATYLYSLK